MINKRGLIRIFIIIFIILIIIGIIFLYLRNNSLNEDNLPSDYNNKNTNGINDFSIRKINKDKYIHETPEEVILEYINSTKNLDLDLFLETINNQERASFTNYFDIETLKESRKIYYDSDGNDLPIEIIKIEIFSHPEIVTFNERIAEIEFKVGDQKYQINAVKEKSSWEILDDFNMYNFNSKY